MTHSLPQQLGQISPSKKSLQEAADRLTIWLADMVVASAAVAFALHSLLQ